MKTTMLSDISIKAIGCDPKDAIRQNASVYLCRLTGNVVDKVTKEDRKGRPYSYYIGNFGAERLSVTDEEKAEGQTVHFRADKFYIPGTLEEKIDVLRKNVSAGKTVQIGYDVYAEPDNGVSFGYRYRWVSLTETAVDDQLSALTESLAAKNPIPGTTVNKENPGTRPDGAKPEPKKK